MKTRYIEMYSLVPWDNQLRKQFCLGYDPYYFKEGSAEGVAASNARELLQSLGVFYYRDIENSKGLLLQPSQGDGCEKFVGKDVILDPPLSCYFFTANVLYPAIRPIDYTAPENITRAENYLNYKEKWGDTKQWLEWNTPKTIIHVTSKFVKSIKKEK